MEMERYDFMKTGILPQENSADLDHVCLGGHRAIDVCRHVTRTLQRAKQH